MEERWDLGRGIVLRSRGGAGAQLSWWSAYDKHSDLSLSRRNYVEKENKNGYV